MVTIWYLLNNNKILFDKQIMKKVLRKIKQNKVIFTRCLVSTIQNVILVQKKTLANKRGLLMILI